MKSLSKLPEEKLFSNGTPTRKAEEKNSKANIHEKIDTN